MSQDRPVRVLLIEDEPDHAQLIQGWLADAAGDAVRAEHIAQFDAGLEALLKHRYDACLLDYRLGPQDGLRLLEAAVAQGCRTPVIVLTSQGDHQLDLRATEAGAADYLDKSTLSGVLLERSIRYAMATRRLEAERERLLSIVEATTDFVGTVDLQADQVVYLNQGGRKLVGLDPEQDLRELRVSNLHPPLALEQMLREAFPAAATNGVWAGETMFRHRDGREIPIWMVLIAQCDAEGRVEYFSTISRDLTARKQTETLLQQSEARFRQSQKLEAVGRLAGGIAHDFNNILTIITGYCDLLLQDLPPDETMHEEVSVIQEAARRAAELTRQLLAFSRKQMLTPELVDLNAAVAEAQKMLRRLIGEDIDLTIQQDPRLGPAKVDPGQLQQVLLNLALNARDAMPRGGTLLLATRRVVIDAVGTDPHTLPPGAYAVVSVRDTGCGMDEATQARIFEPFFSTKGEGEGTGLGLPTVFGIVTQSGGHIAVETAPGEGTTFDVFLPEALADDVVEGVVAPPQAASRVGNETILLVEDEPTVRDVAKRILEKHGYRVLEASDGDTALRLAKEYPDRIDLLLTDVVMPGCSGTELAARLRPARPFTRVLFMSGYTDDAVVRHGVLASESSFIQKPLSVVELTQKVREVLEQAPRGMIFSAEPVPRPFGVRGGVQAPLCEPIPV